MLREHIPSHDFPAEQGHSACPQNYGGSFFKKSFYGRKVDKIVWKTLCVCLGRGGQGEWEFVLHAQIRDQIMSTGGGVTKIYFPVI